MNTRSLRKLLREPLWLLLAAAAVLGATLGIALAHELDSDPGRAVFGRAWRGDPTETRGALAGLLGFQITLVTLVLSLNAMVIKSAAYQYSPRLIPLYLQHAPIRRALPMFVLLMAYILAAVRELGLVADDGVRPRLVVSVGVVLLFVALLLLLVDLLRTVRFLRVERVLGLVREGTFAAERRIRGRISRLPLDAAATLAPSRGASQLVAGESGYLVDIDMERLTRLAREARVRARVDHAIGDYVDEGESIGWVAADDGKAVDPRTAHDLAATLAINAVRELDYDPALGVRIIVDVVNRSLSSSANDPYTARQALNELRSVLRHVTRLPLGDWNVVDPDGAVRVSVAATHLRDLLAVAVGGPRRYGEEDPDVLEGLLEITLEVGRIARDSEDRAAVRAILAKLEELTKGSEFGAARAARLSAEAEPVRRQLSDGDGAAARAWASPGPRS